jgi:hypothetical protein
MLRITSRSFFFALVAVSLTATDAVALERLQNRQRSWPGSSNPLGALGILPESVQSILLIHSGKSFSKEKAEQLEGDLRKNPDNIENHLEGGCRTSGSFS